MDNLKFPISNFSLFLSPYFVSTHPSLLPQRQWSTFLSYSAQKGIQCVPTRMKENNDMRFQIKQDRSILTFKIKLLNTLNSTKSYSSLPHFLLVWSLKFQDSKEIIVSFLSLIHYLKFNYGWWMSMKYCIRSKLPNFISLNSIKTFSLQTFTSLMLSQVLFWP